MENQEKELEEGKNEEEEKLKKETKKDSKNYLNPIAVEELLFMFILVNDITKLILQDKELSHEKIYQEIRCHSEKYYIDNRRYYSNSQFIFHEDITINHNNADIIIEGWDKLEYEDINKALEMHEISETGFLNIPRLVLLLSEESFWNGLYDKAKNNGNYSINDYHDSFCILKEELQSYSEKIETLSYIPVGIKKCYRLALSTSRKIISMSEMTVKAKSLFLYKLLTEAGVKEDRNLSEIARFIAKLIGSDENTIYGYFKHIKKAPMERKKGEYISGAVDEIMNACQSLLKTGQGTESVFKKVYADFVVMKEKECDTLKQYAYKKHHTQTLSDNPQNIAE